MRWLVRHLLGNAAGMFSVEKFYASLKSQGLRTSKDSLHNYLAHLEDVLNGVKACQEVCRIFCATANPLQVIVASSEQGNGIMGVIDGSKPKGIETEENRQHRKDLLRKFRYKL